MPDMILTQQSSKPQVRCSVCNQELKLTFEHIPPRSCYNQQQLMFHSLDSIFEGHDGMKRYRKGLGKKTTCAKCNNEIANQYQRAFMDWTSKGMDLVEKISDFKPNTFIYHNFILQPGLVAKQIAFMACACNDDDKSVSPQFRLLQLIASSPRTHIPLRDSRVYCYLTDATSSPRLNGFMSPVHAGRENQVVWAEIALCPFGYVVISEGEKTSKEAARIGLCDITRFFDYTPIELTSIYLRLPLLEPIGPSSLDYNLNTAVYD